MPKINEKNIKNSFYDILLTTHYSFQETERSRYANKRIFSEYRCK